MTTNETYAVLMVEDNPGDADLVREWMADCPDDRFQLTHARTLAEAVDCLGRGGFDAVLLDLSLPDSAGLETVRRLRAGAPDVAVVVLTGLDDDEVGVQAVRQGAQDYLTKGRLDGQLLARAVRYAVERRRAERQIRETEARLRQAEKMEAIGLLAGGVAHHFNNLMTVVTGFTEMALAQLPSGNPLADMLRTVKGAGERAAGLTQQLLALSRKQLLAFKDMDLNAFVGGMQPALARLVGERIDLITELEPALGRVRADPMQMQQILIHLAANARDAMPQGGRLTVRTANLELPGNPDEGVQPGPYVALAVTDTGCGMTDVVKTHVFEPFFTTKEMGQGTGLGLATVHGIVRQMGGHVAFDSDPGAGTTFRVYLHRLEPPHQPAATAGAGAPAGSFRGNTVLLAEDEPAVRGLVRHVLQGSGYTVLEATNGAEALALAERHPEPIDLLVTDAVMPLMTGSDLATRLRAQRPRLKVLYLTGSVGEEGPGQAAAQGTALLPKPFAPQALAEKVQELLDGSSCQPGFRTSRESRPCC